VTITKTQRVVVTVAGGVIGSLLGYVLTQHGTVREKALTTILSGTAGIGVAQTALNIASME
jgi:hypothetical protein